MGSSMEHWRDVIGFEGYYQVSDHGRVRSVDRMSSGRRYVGRVLSDYSMSSGGYGLVSLSVDGEVTNRFVHHLVMEAFVGLPPKGMEINHKDGDKTNSKLSNLEYVTHSQNMIHAHRTGLSPSGENRTQAKLTDKQVAYIRENRGVITGAKLSRMFKVSQSLISHIQTGKRRNTSCVNS